MFGKLGAPFGAFVYGGSYHLRGRGNFRGRGGGEGGGGGVSIMAPHFFRIAQCALQSGSNQTSGT